jgi:hypothetical protein
MHLWFILVALLAFASASRASEVRVILWFDTEDYLLPADDDASKRLAEMLTEKGVRATFKLVGEKARVLEKRGRKDVIAALQKHDIGYHANFHSVHPTPSEYLASCGFLDGIAEFVRREGPGAADVRRIFQVPTLSCYGQPGSSWGSQTLAGLREIGVAPHGIGCYVDEGNHVGYRGIPYWYENAIVVYNMGDNWTRMELHDPAQEEAGHKKAAAIADRLRQQDKPGLISIFYHPCEWVHQEFWDGVNFRRGANPPREQWKPPGQLTPEKTEAAFQRFAGYIDFIKSLPNVRFVTATDLPVLYADATRQQEISKMDLSDLAQRILEGGGIDAQDLGGKIYSPADQFELLVKACAAPFNQAEALKPTGAFGPSETCGSCISLQDIEWLAFRDSVLDSLAFLREHKRIPSRVFVGSEAISPENFLAFLAHGFLKIQGGRKDSIHIEGLFGGWVIHKEGFRAPKILEVARLQAWTLKPAVPR